MVPSAGAPAPPAPLALGTFCAITGENTFDLEMGVVPTVPVAPPRASWIRGGDEKDIDDVRRDLSWRNYASCPRSRRVRRWGNWGEREGAVPTAHHSSEEGTIGRDLAYEAGRRSPPSNHGVRRGATARRPPTLHERS